MGCKAICGSTKGSSQDNEKSNRNSTDGKQKGIIITIKYPDANQQPYTYHYIEQELYKDKQNVQIMDVMNNLTWGRGKEQPAVFDGNFISIYNPVTDRYHYFCHRLLNNPNNPYQGRIWVPYINNKKYDWDYLIENNKVISLNGGKITWQLEQMPEKKEVDFVKASKLQSTAISVADVQINIQQNK